MTVTAHNSSCGKVMSGHNGVGMSRWVCPGGGYVPGADPSFGQGGAPASEAESC